MACVFQSCLLIRASASVGVCVCACVCIESAPVHACLTIDSIADFRPEGVRKKVIFSK